VCIEEVLEDQLEPTETGRPGFMHSDPDEMSQDDQLFVRLGTHKPNKLSAHYVCTGVRV